MRTFSKLLFIAACAVSTAAMAQSKSTADAINEYRAMLADGDPAELFEAKEKDRSMEN